MGSQSDFHGCLTPLSAYVSIINNRSFCPILVRFVHYDSSFWCPRAISTIDKPRCACTCRSSTFANFVESDPFHGQLLTVLGSKAISIVVEPQGALRVFQQHWQSWPIQARLVDYYSMFWGPRVIYTIDEPRGALTCRSSTIALFCRF